MPIERFPPRLARGCTQKSGGRFPVGISLPPDYFASTRYVYPRVHKWKTAPTAHCTFYLLFLFSSCAGVSVSRLSCFLQFHCLYPTVLFVAHRAPPKYFSMAKNRGGFLLGESIKIFEAQRMVHGGYASAAESLDSPVDPFSTAIILTSLYSTGLSLIHI